MNRYIPITGIFLIAMLVTSCSEFGKEAGLNDALSYFENGDYKASLIVTKALIDESPSNPTYRHLMAKIYFNVGDYSNSLLEWRKGDKLGGDEMADASSRIYAYLQTGSFDDLLHLEESLYAGDDLAELRAAKVLAKVSLELPINNPIQQIDSLLADSSRPSLWNAKALLLLNERRPDDALEALDSGLAVTPDNVLAKSLKADISALKTNYDQAISLYSEVVDDHPWRHGDLLKRAGSYIQAGDLDRAEKDINYLIKLYPKGVSVNYAKGIIDFQRNNLEKSIQSFKVAENDTQVFSSSLLYLASANRTLGNYLQSEDYAQRYFGSNPNDKHGRLMLASIYLEDGKYADVVELLNGERDKFIGNEDFAKIYGSALALYDRDEGLDYLEKNSKELKSLDLYVMFGTLLHQGEQYLESNVAVDEGLAISPDSLKLRYLKIMNLASLQNVESALSEAKLVVSGFPSESSLSMLLDIYHLSGNMDKWKETLLLLDRDYPGSERANLELAKLERERGNLKRAEEYYQSILSQDSDNKSARLELFSLSVAKNEWGQAERQLIDLIDLYPKDLKVRSMLADFYLNRHEYSKAKSIFSSVLEEVYDDRAAYGLYIRAFIEEGEYEDAKFHLQRYAQLMPNSPIPGYLSARISAKAKNSDAMLSGLEQSLESNPSFYPSILAMAKYQLLQKNTRELKNYVDKLMELAPSLSDTKYITAKYHELNGDHDLSSVLAEEVYQTELSDESMAYWALTCLKSKSINCLNKAVDVYATANERSLMILRNFGGYYVYLGDEARAITAYEELLVLDSKNIEALNNLGWLYSSIDPVKSLDYSTRAFELAPESSQVLDTYAMSLIEIGDTERALAAINKAIQIEPKNNTFRFHKAYAASKSGSVEEALRILKSLMSQEVEFPEKPQAELLMVKLEESVY